MAQVLDCDLRNARYQDESNAHEDARDSQMKDKPALIAAILFMLMILDVIAVMTIMVVSAGPSFELNQATAKEK